ncbi:sulfotransferase family protein [Jatrophihabitans sp. YIM 134969]
MLHAPLTDDERDAVAQHHFVFVGGMHRSGTTILAEAIASAVDGAGLEDTNVMMDEGQFLQDVFPLGRDMGGVTRWALDDRAYLDERDYEFVPNVTARLWRSWSPYWDTSNKILVEKTPLNITRTRFLQAAFPRSSFVIITRHPVTQALAARKWSKTRPGHYGVGLPLLVEQWVRAHEAFAIDQQFLQRTYVVRYEDLMHDPMQVRAQLEQFLETEIPPTTFEKVDPLRALSYSDAWIRATAPGALKSSVKSLRDLTPADRARSRALLKNVAETSVLRHHRASIAAEFGGRVRRLGYDVNQLDVAEPWLQ